MTVIGQGSSPLILELQYTLKKNANEIINKIVHLQGNTTFITQSVKSTAEWNKKKKTQEGKDIETFSPF